MNDLFAAVPQLAVCLTPGPVPSAAPYRIPCPGSSAGLRLSAPSEPALKSWLEDAARRRVAVRFDGEAFLAWWESASPVYRDVAIIEGAWAELRARWGLPVPLKRTPPALPPDADTPCYHAWRTTQDLPATARDIEGEWGEELWGKQAALLPIEAPRRFALDESADLVFGDVETTGLSPAKGDRVIQLALRRVSGTTGEVTEFDTLINPEGRRSTFGAQKAHRIDHRRLAAAPKFRKVAKQTHRLLSGAVFIGHNAKRCDEKFLRAELERCERSWPCIAVLDTLPLARKVWPGLPSYALGDLAESLNLSAGKAHDAVGDVQTTVSLFYAIRAMRPDLPLAALVLP